MRLFLSSQQNGELPLVSFTRLELVHEAEACLSTRTLDRSRGDVEVEVFNNAVSRTLFLGITSRRVDTRTLAESVACSQQQHSSASV